MSKFAMSNDTISLPVELSLSMAQNVATILNNSSRKLGFTKQTTDDEKFSILRNIILKYNGVVEIGNDTYQFVDGSIMFRSGRKFGYRTI